MRVGSLLLLAIPAIAACGSDGPDESVSGVFPHSAFLGRQMRVEISGDTTNWKDGTTVNFGAGVTVANVTVASPTALFADITVAPDAAPGLRDVTVDKLVMKEAFQLESAISLKVLGTLAQGSVVSFAINNHDFDTPFDDTSTGDGLFTPIEFTNTSIEGFAGATFQVETVTPYAITGLALIDVDASAGGPIKVVSGVGDAAITSNLGEDVTVAARTATPLVSGTPATGMVEKPWSSALYEFTPTGAPVLLKFSATSTSSAATPGVAILGPSGKFDELLAYSGNTTMVATASSKLYLVYVDTQGGSGYSFNVRASGQMMMALTEAEPNNTVATAATATAAPVLFQTATLSSATDVDWIKFTATAADVGKKVRVKTMGTDPQTDTVVQVFKANGTDALGGPSNDQNYHEDHTSAAIDAAGVYTVKVTASSVFVATHNAYTAAVWIE